MDFSRKLKRVSIVGVNGNAFYIIGYVCGAMNSAFNVAKEEKDKIAQSKFGIKAQEKFEGRATSGDYDHLLVEATLMVNEINEYLEETGRIEKEA